MMDTLFTLYQHLHSNHWKALLCMSLTQEGFAPHEPYPGKAFDVFIKRQREGDMFGGCGEVWEKGCLLGPMPRHPFP